MKNISFENVRITGGFWNTKQHMLLRTSRSVYERFRETFRFEAMNVGGWLERLLAEEKGQEKVAVAPKELTTDDLANAGAPSKDRPRVGHIFWDSDIAKWIEGTAYLIEIAKAWEKTGDDLRELASLEELCDETIGNICRSAEACGYFNSHFQVTEALGEEKRFTDRSQHELYCAGHLIEAAIAYERATGKKQLTELMCRYADYIQKVFMIENRAAFETPGHPELELALIKLWEHTGERRYLELSKHFIDLHGVSAKDVTPYKVFNDLYNQDEMPLRKRTTAEGHCVRAMYLLSGMADVALACQDAQLMDACRRIYDNVVNHRMYVTGGIGSTHLGEAFTIDYHLPDRTAYTETCAAIALAQASRRMFAGSSAPGAGDAPDLPLSLYADTVERTIYNGILSGISPDGIGFFYENPLRIDLRFNDPNSSTKQKEYYPETQRREVFECSCCPPNVLRFYASLGDYLYTIDEGTLYVHQFMESTASIDEGLTIRQVTDYPLSGSIGIRIERKPGCGINRLALRLPGWCRKYQLDAAHELKDGYLYVDLTEDVTEIRYDLEMAPRFVQADPRIHDYAGQIAVARGPVVYCLEGVDQPEMDIHTFLIDPSETGVMEDVKAASTGDSFLLPAIRVRGWIPSDKGKKDGVSDTRRGLYGTYHDYLDPATAVLIPYFAFASRGESDMRVWLPLR